MLICPSNPLKGSLWQKLNEMSASVLISDLFFTLECRMQTETLFQIVFNLQLIISMRFGKPVP